MNKINFTLKVMKCPTKGESAKEVGRFESTSYRRFYNHAGTINWNNLIKNGGWVYLRVSDENGYNDGEYTNRKDFLTALEAFIDG